MLSSCHNCCDCCCLAVQCSCCCHLSQGKKGQGVIPAFASLYSNDTQKQVTPNVPVDFDFLGPMFNTDADTDTDAITVFRSGVYEISTSLNVIALAASDVAQFEIRRNNAPIPGSLFQTMLDSNQTSIAKVIQVYLAAGDSITLVPILGTNVSYFSAALTVNRIGKK